MRKSKEYEVRARLDNYVKEYCVLEQAKKDCFREANLKGDYSSARVLTLTVTQERINTLVKQICICVSRLLNTDLGVDNEIAIQVYDLANRQF